MKIRTRLLLFLLPTFIGSIALVSGLLAYNWHGEIVDGFKTRLKSAVLVTAAMNSLDLEKMGQTQPKIDSSSCFGIGISDLYIAPAHLLSFIPKEVYITPIYKKDQRKLMTGYAPIYDQTGKVAHLMAADISVDLIDAKFQESLFLIFVSAGFTSLVMVSTLYFIANKISTPVQKLNNSALAIAAGQYGESIEAEGPKEIAELANTLNTMSECLHENINRLKENSLLRERMYGEYECATLLQHLMLQKNIDDCRSDATAVKPITLFSENPKGLLLDFPKSENPRLFRIHMAEAEEEGFEGMYQLLTQYKFSKESQAHTSILFDRAQSTLECKGSQLPLIWSVEQSCFLPTSLQPIQVDVGDFFFLFNQGLISFYKNPQKIADLLAKVLKIFAQDGLETITAMLQKEISFATKRKELQEDIHLLCFQILGAGNG
jgi:HAMP domain-containing protein